jgi:alkyl sulfatase BDS1-like metallo-beta-lactamase superfamily hydrolase
MSKKKTINVLILIVIIIVIVCVMLICLKKNQKRIVKYNYKSFCMENITITYNDKNLTFNDLVNMNFDFDGFIGTNHPEQIYRDGGSRLYNFNNYYVISCNTISGNTDKVFVGKECFEENDYCK